jgi:serine protease Do
VVETLREFHDGDTVLISVQREHEVLEKEVKMSGRNPFPERRIRRLGGELSQRAEGFEKVIEHDTVLQPWLCGGPLVNLDGKALGINIARASRVTTYALPASLVKQILENLEARISDNYPASARQDIK